jgi:hypothetical protein
MMDMRRRFTSRDVSADLAVGQSVIVTARWVLVFAGLVFAIWNPSEIGRLRMQLLVLFALALANFYLHAQLLLRRPAIDAVAYAASALDITVISLLVLLGHGFSSQLYIFYIPALLGLSLVFPTESTIAFTGMAVAVYGFIGLAGVFPDRPDDLPTLVTRLLMFAAVAFCGNLYWRIEHQWRAEAEPTPAVDRVLEVEPSAAEPRTFAELRT